MKISVVINTYNSEKFLRRVLESVKAFDEVLICDMHSTDSTLELAKEYNCRIVYAEKHPYVEPVRNHAVHSATHEWVLVVDSDEVVPEALRHYLYEWIQQPDCPAGLWIARKNYFFGQFMEGDYPGYILRFFRKEGSYWPPYIHSTVQLQGKAEYLPAKKKELALIHLINNTVENRLNKINAYSAQEVERRKNQSFPYFKLFYAPAFRFIKNYFFKGGIKAGKAGLVSAGMNAIYKFVTIAKIWESRINPEDMDSDLRG